MSIDLNAIRRAVDPRAPERGNIHCPIHDDRNPSLSVDIKNGKLVCTCHAGCDQDELWQAITDACKPLGLLNGEARDTGIRHLYEYHDASGKTIAGVVRTDFANGNKKFWQQVPDDNGGWIKHGPNGKTPLYRLDVIAQHPDACVIICEGEKAAEAAQRQLPDYVCTSWMGGAKGVARADYSPLMGRDVIVWPDADPPGYEAAATLAKIITPIAASVRTVRVTDLPLKADAADVSWDAVELLGRCTGSKVPATPAIAPLPLIWTSDVGANDISMPEIVEDVYSANGLSVIYGPSNSGKSYLTLHIDCAIARGVAVLGKRTNAGLVVYVAGEGSASIKMRLAAYKRHHELADFPLAIVPCPISLLDPYADTGRIIDAIKRAQDHYGIACAKVTIDTLARAFGGGNENSSEDMGAVIRNADLIRDECKVHLAFVHHSGKDESKGSRGHSSLRAATDTEIEVSDSGNGVHTLEVVKQRDIGSLGLRLSGRFLSLPFGSDQWGKSLTVCVVEDVEAAPKQNRTQLGKHQKLLVAKLRADGPMIRADALAFMKSVDVPHRSRYTVIDSLLLAGVVEDTLLGLKAKE